MRSERSRSHRHRPILGLDAAPVISVTGDFDFGTSPVGVPKAKVMTIQNTGNALLTLTLPVTITGGGFTVTSQPSDTTLEPGETTSFTIEASAAAHQTYNASFNIGNDSEVNPYTQAITIVAVQAVLGLTGAGGNAITNGSAASGTNGTDFGGTPVGVPDTLIVTAINTGDDDLSITAIGLPSGFTHNAALPLTITPGNNSAITLTATPTSLATFSGNVTITNNSAVSAFSFGVTAQATAHFKMTFGTPVAAPLPSTINADIGVLAVHDVESLMSISSDKWQIPAQVSAAWTDEYGRAQPDASTQFWTRPTGYALVAVATVNHSTRNEQLFGWWNAASLGNSPRGGVYTLSNNFRAAQGSSAVSDSQAYSATTDYQVAAVWTSWGVLIYVKISDIWHLKWVRFDVFTQGYCGVSNLSSAGTIDDFKIVAVDESVFAAALDITNPSAGNLTNAPDGDVFMYLDNLTRPSSGTLNLPLRKKDTSNSWPLTVTSAGAFTVDEKLNGSTLGSRISGSGVVSTDDLIVIARANVLAAWRNTTALGSVYSAAYNYLREVGLELNSLGTGGAIGNLKAWKARLLTTNGLGSELVSNGSFTGAATGWSLGSGWTYSANAVHKGAGVGDSLDQTIGAVTIGKYYRLEFTVSNYSAGTLTPRLGSGSGNSVPVSANGTYVFEIYANTTNLRFLTDSAFAGTIDNVSVKEILFTDDSLATILNGVLAA